MGAGWHGVTLTLVMLTSIGDTVASVGSEAGDWALNGRQRYAGAGDTANGGDMVEPGTNLTVVLTGDNICTRRETFTVPVKVLKKIAYQTRYYAFCWSLTFRCSRYRIEWKNEIREEVSWTLAGGCWILTASLFLRTSRSSGSCWSVVLATRGAVTAARVCLCAGTRVSTARVSALTRVSATRASGGRIAQNVRFRKKREWKLYYCVSAVCEPGRWGPGCQRTCPCQHGATCDPVSGACTCAPGYHGPLCATRCDEGRYGLHCAETCRCQNGEWGIIWSFVTPRSYFYFL